MRSQGIEQVLNRQGVRWTYEPAVAWERVDEASARKNPARVGPQPVSHEAVERYALAYKAGDEFPAIVLAVRAEGGYFLLDGAHRRLACQAANLPFHDAYIIHENDVGLLRVLQGEFNLVNGLPMPKEQAVAYAKVLVRQFGVAVEEAATRLKIRQASLADALRADEVRLQAGKLGLAQLSPTTGNEAVITLGRLPSDALFKAAWTLAREAGLGAPEARELVKTTLRERSEADQLAAIAAYRERPAIQRSIARARQGYAKPRAGFQSKKLRLIRQLNALLEMLNRAPTLEALGVTDPADRTTIEQLWAQAVQRMEIIRGTGNDRVDQAPVRRAR